MSPAPEIDALILVLTLVERRVYNVDPVRLGWGPGIASGAHYASVMFYPRKETKCKAMTCRSKLGSRERAEKRRFDSSQWG
ncbi:hypothetical protein TWF718_001266 [Orbilia javanica]|uniref:Uncharacterized protein n=1 Tax=Orbilia javanica TaxID=47235 RepID=A0AAN8N118_9PEZI